MADARSLHIENARVVGHYTGLMVAYAYAAQFPNETEKRAAMDAFRSLSPSTPALQSRT